MAQKKKKKNRIMGKKRHPANRNNLHYIGQSIYPGKSSLLHGQTNSPNKTSPDDPIKRFGIWLAELPDLGADSHIQQGTRPVIVVSNDMANTYSPTVTVLPLTTRKKKQMPTHTVIFGYGLRGKNVVLGEQILSIDRDRLKHPIGHIDNKRVQERICRIISIQLSDLSEENKEEYLQNTDG